MPKSLKHKVRTRDRAAAPSAIEIYSDAYFESPRRRRLEFLSVLIAFLGGAFVVFFHFKSGTSITVSEDWKFLLVPAGTLCIGFGAAALLYGRLREKQTRALREQFAALHSRADALVANFDKFERGEKIS